MKAVRANNIVKVYGSKKARVNALQGVSFEVGTGELFGIIGPDGAGKTSLFRILATLLLPDNGSASINNLDVVKDARLVRRQVGYMPGRFSLYQDLTVAENLRFFATIRNTTPEENFELVKDIYLQIEPFKNRRAGKLSGGMKQKLALCCALIHRPSILFLDEPTTGVDAVSRKEFWDMLRALKKQNITILVSTPYMDEAVLCDRVSFIQNGKLLSVDTPENIKKGFQKPLYAARGKHMPSLLNKLKAVNGIADAYSFGEYHHVVLDNEHAVVPVKEHLHSSNAEIELVPVEPNMEDCFIALMKIAHG